MTTVAEVARIRVAGREEYVLRSGAIVPGRIAILLVPPLFGEMNRTRRLIADILRALVRHDRAAAVPDLPATGESPTMLSDVTFADWRAAVRATGDVLREETGVAPLVASLRGGALLDDAASAAGRWRLTSIDGSAVLRDLGRAQRITGGAAIAGHAFAGTALPVDLADPLAVAVVKGDARIARLEDDPRPADLRLTGGALWRRAEAGHDVAMAAVIAADLDRMAASCAGS